MKIFPYILLFFTLAFSLPSYGQYGSEEEMKEAAEELFEEKKFSEAMPLYSRLLSLYPKDPGYNFKYGTCLLYGDEDKEKPLKFLKFGTSKSNVSYLSYYYLGRAYHLNYYFDDAIRAYRRFKNEASGKEEEEYQVDQVIRMCENGKELLENVKDISVIDRKEVGKEDFFRVYDLRGIGGNIIVKPSEFKTKEDRKEKESSVIYLPDKKETDEVYYSSYGDKGKSGKDIFRIKMMPDNSWGEPERLGETINTPFDEDYPYMHPDGKTLYFSSKGHNSMGGYDIFRSSYDESTGTWSTPENLDFAINSPDDDILFISDIDNQLAYFASSRSSKEGRMHVYHVEVTTRPADNALVKGKLITENNDASSAKVTVKDPETGKTLGVYLTKEQSGDYLLVLPNDGKKYELLVETTDDAPIHSGTIEVPQTSDTRPFKQELRLVGEGDSQKLVIKNKFNEREEMDATDPLMVQNFIKKKAELDVNTTKDEVLASADGKEESDSGESGDEDAVKSEELAGMSDQEMSISSFDKANKLKAEAREVEEDSEQAFRVAADKSKRADDLFEEADSLREVASETENSTEKEELQKLASRKEKKAREAANDATVAYRLAKGLENEANEKQSDSEKAFELAQKVEEGINSENRDEAVKQYNEQEKLVKSSRETTPAEELEKKFIDEKLNKTTAELNQSKQYVEQLKDREKELEKQVEELETEAENTRRRKKREEIEAKAEALKIDLEDVRYDLKRARDKTKELTAEETKLKSQKETTGQLFTELKEGKSEGDDVTEEELALLDEQINYYDENKLNREATPSEEDEEIGDAGEEEQESLDLVELSDEYEIVSDEGKVVDYNTDYSNALVETESEQDEYQRQLQIAKVNQEWVKAIDEELDIRQKQLESTNDEQEKQKLQNRINELQPLKSQKENDALASLEKAESLQSGESEKEEGETASTDDVEPVRIMNDEGELIDYSSQFETELSQLENEASGPEKENQKAEINKKWANALTQEAALNKLARVESEDEEEQAELSARIDSLESEADKKLDLATQYEETAEGMKEEELAEETGSGEDSDSQEEEPEGMEFNYKNNVKYINPSASVDLKTAWDLKNEAEKLSADAEQKLQEAYDASTEEEKEALFQEADELDQQSREKKVEAAELYGKVNQNEVSTNEQLLEKLGEAIPDKESEEVGLAELYREEAQFYAEEAQKEREKAKAAENINIKEASLKDAYENEVVALEKQKKAKELYIESGGDEIARLAEQEESAIKQGAYAQDVSGDEEEGTDSSPNRNGEDSGEEDREGDGQEDEDTEEDTIASIEDDEADSDSFDTTGEENREGEDQKGEETEEETTVSVEDDEADTDSFDTTDEGDGTEDEVEPGDSENEVGDSSEKPDILSDPRDKKELLSVFYFDYDRAKELNDQADALESEAQALRDSANSMDRKRDREDLIELAEEKEEEVERIRSEADVLYDQAKKKEEEEKQLAEERASVREEARSIDSEDEVGETLTQTEKEKLADIPPSEIEELKASDDYQTYDNLKKSSRKLVKTAEVEYEEAEEAEDQAREELKLANTLNAFKASADTERDRRKFEGQIAELKRRAENNVSKSDSLQESAFEKQQEALEKEKASEEFIATLDEETSEKIRLVKKATVVGDDYLAAGSGEQGDSAEEEEESDDTTTALTEEDTESPDQNGEESTEIADDAGESERREGEDENEDEGTTTEEEDTEEEGDDEPDDTTTALAGDETDGSEQSGEEDTEVANDTGDSEESDEENENTLAEEEEEGDTGEDSDDTISELTGEDDQDTGFEEEEDTEIAEDTGEEGRQEDENQEEDDFQIDPIQPGGVDVSMDDPVMEKIPDRIDEDIFVISDQARSAYNEGKPIPKGNKQPEGLVFKVQVGAFRNPIPQDLFKGFAPISAQEGPNGITRYTAGYFKKFSSADQAKEEIRNIGYNDAFVVAFNDGERIPINEAMAMLDEGAGGGSENSESDTFIAEENTGTEETGGTNESVVTEDPSKEVEEIGGLFYTVQVGVFSSPVQPGDLQNVRPLNSDRTSNGYIRYSSGVYNDVEEAQQAKQRIVNKGISDAFVTAYYQGERISVDRAGELESEGVPVGDGGEGVDDRQPVEDDTQDGAGATDDTETDDDEDVVEDTDTKSQEDIAEELGLEFVIQLGKYEDEVPVNDAASYLRLKSRGEKVRTRETLEATVYLMGPYLSIKEAMNILARMKEEEELSKAKLIAYREGEEIEMDEALDLIRNNK